MRCSSISRFCAPVRVAAQSAERLKVTLKCHHRTLLHMHGEKKQLMSNYAQQKSQRSITPLHAILGNLEANLL